MWYLVSVNCKKNRQECEKGVKLHFGLLFIKKDRHLTVYLKLNLVC